MAYRVTVTDTTPTDRGTIRFVCVVETDATGTWQPLQDAPAYIDIHAEQLLAVLRRSASDADKRTELQAIFRAHTRSLPLLIAAATVDQIDELLVSGWPITINL
jgi:hypothetical protein